MMIENIDDQWTRRRKTILKTEEVFFDRILNAIEEGVGLESDNEILHDQYTVTVFHI